MKLKYYISHSLIKHIIIVLLIATIFVSIEARAYTLDSNISVKSIFKCQQTTIWANITGGVGITGVDVWVNNTNLVFANGTDISTYTKYAMTDFGANHWYYTYGNDPTLIHGNKTLSFDVVSGGIKTYNNNVLQFLVYSDKCTGANIVNYTQINGGYGQYTTRLWTTNINIVEFGLYPWVEYWGYFFYLIIIAVTCISVYMKTEKIIAPILIAVISLGIFATTTLPIIPPDFRQQITMILGLAVGGIMYRIFKG